MSRSPEDDRIAILQVFASQELEYAGFVLTFAVAVFAEISLLSYSYIPHYLVWAAIVASGLGAALCLESYLELVELTQICVDERPFENLGENSLGTLWHRYLDMLKKSKFGKVVRFRERNWWFRLIVLCPVVWVALSFIFGISKIG